MAPREIDLVVLHCTDGAWGNVESIRGFHTAAPPAGRGWSDIGYHYVIGNAFPTFESLHDRRPVLGHDGKILAGRDIDRDGDVEEHIGAHVRGHNKHSIGIAMVGTGGVFSAAQVRSALELVRDVCARHSVLVERVKGHTELDAGKSCPDLDMTFFRDWISKT